MPGHAQGRDRRDGPMMDRGGIATGETPAENRAGMRAQGSIDRVVARSPTRVFDPDMDISVETTTVTTATPCAPSRASPPPSPVPPALQDRRVHIRNTALPNADQAAIYHAMQITPPAPNRRKTIV